MIKHGQRKTEGIGAIVAYLRTEFPGEVIGHDDASGEHHFYVGHHHRPRHRLLLGANVLENALPLNLIVKLQDADVARRLREAGTWEMR